MKRDISLEDASKRLEVAFKETEKRLDVVGEKVDAALIDSEKQKGSTIVSENISATQLLKQVHDVKTEFKIIVDQVDDLKKNHEEFLTEILQELKNATLAVESLKSLAPDESANAKMAEKELRQTNTKTIVKQKGKMK